MLTADSTPPALARTTTLGDGTGTDTVTVSSLATGTQRAVLASATGVLSAVSTIPEALLPNITVGDVFTYSTNTDTKTAAETEFYLLTPGSGGVTPGQPYHKGDIAIITYDADGSSAGGTGTAVLIYVGANQTTAGPSTAADWHDISITSQGIMSVSGDTTTINVTAGNTPVVSAITGAPVDGPAVVWLAPT